MPEDTVSIAVLVLGPASIAALIGVVIYWLRHRGTKPDRDPPGGPQAL